MPTHLKLSFSLYRPPSDISLSVGVYHPYFIVASTWLTEGSGVATIIPLNDDSPIPEKIHFVVASGGPTAAITEARDAVLALPANQGLHQMPTDVNRFQEW